MFTFFENDFEDSGDISSLTLSLSKLQSFFLNTSTVKSLNRAIFIGPCCHLRRIAMINESRKIKIVLNSQ